MKTGFYPGCSLTGTAREYNDSLFAICKVAGIELIGVPDWNCCGASAAHNLNHELSILLPARILGMAGLAEMEEVVVPCAACYNRLLSTQQQLGNDEQLKSRISNELKLPLNNPVKLLNILQFLEKNFVPRLAALVKIPLVMNVACYYGCLLVRPPKILAAERFEDPVSMDEIMHILGANPIDWPFKTECCGAGFSVSRPAIVGELSGKILRDALEHGAKAIVVACPMCHANLDMRRPAIENYLKCKIDIPVIYITQAIALAMGLTAGQTGLKRHFVPVHFAGIC